MKNLCILAILLFQLSGFAQINYTDTISSGGILRTFRVYVPAVYSTQTPRPLVFQFHGYGGNAISSEQNGRFKLIADTANYILITPNGTVDPAYPSYGQGWNTYFCCFTADDVLFVSDMIDSLKSQFNIDTTRIYAAGFSNGGMMCYELACKLGNKIAAIGSVAGTMVASRLKACNPTREVPVLEIHGTADYILPWNGIITGIDTFSAIPSVIDFWVNANQCTKSPIVIDLPDINTNDGSNVTKYLYDNCACNRTIELFKVNGGEHTAPGGPVGTGTNQDMIATTEIWRFFRSHTLNCPSSFIEKPAELNWSFYPNPFKDIIHIELQKEDSYKINIYDEIGRLVYSSNINKEGRELTFDGHSLENGVYMMELLSSNLKTTKKIVKIE